MRVTFNCKDAWTAYSKYVLDGYKRERPDDERFCWESIPQIMSRPIDNEGHFPLLTSITCFPKVRHYFCTNPEVGGNHPRFSTKPLDVTELSGNRKFTKQFGWAPIDNDYPIFQIYGFIKHTDCDQVGDQVQYQITRCGGESTVGFITNQNGANTFVETLLKKLGEVVVPESIEALRTMNKGDKLHPYFAFLMARMPAECFGGNTAPECVSRFTERAFTRCARSNLLSGIELASKPVVDRETGVVSFDIDT